MAALIRAVVMNGDGGDPWKVVVVVEVEDCDGPRV
jgi:hypothetical protein